jgi:hypothetical protein
MFKILFIDDKDFSVEDAKALLVETDKHYCHVCTFNDAEMNIKHFSPDVIILDLLEGDPSSESTQTGRDTLNLIWGMRFCPIIFYTAVPEYLDDDPRVLEHPFVNKVKKGSGSHVELQKKIHEFSEHIIAIQNAKYNLDQTFSTAIRDVAECAYKEHSDTKTRNEIITRCGRRRVSALIDNNSSTEKIASWEQYIYPPIGNSLKLGDVIQKNSNDPSKETSFRIVLTPSCDLVTESGRKPKVNNTLVAKCIPIRSLKHCRSLPQNDSTLETLKANFLRPGYNQKMLVLPKLPNIIPDMIADLKSLELIPITDISKDNTKPFKRIASVDSPFRELVSWAYMQTACRPGLPDRDFEAWAESIMPQLEPQG